MIHEEMKRPITPREMQVLSLICEGKTAKEIADKLGIARSTVESYRQNLLVKLNAKNAVELALKAERIGLLK
jgi:DNA-binding NarL/FixJ family response regulator